MSLCVSIRSPQNTKPQLKLLSARCFYTSGTHWSKEKTALRVPGQTCQDAIAGRRSSAQSLEPRTSYFLPVNLQASNWGKSQSTLGSAHLSVKEASYLVTCRPFFFFFSHIPGVAATEAGGRSFVVESEISSLLFAESNPATIFFFYIYIYIYAYFICLVWPLKCLCRLATTLHFQPKMLLLLQVLSKARCFTLLLSAWCSLTPDMTEAGWFIDQEIDLTDQEVGVSSKVFRFYWVKKKKNRQSEENKWLQHFSMCTVAFVGCEIKHQLHLQSTVFQGLWGCCFFSDSKNCGRRQRLPTVPWHVAQ